MSSKVHTGFGHDCKRINKSQLDCLEHNDLITYLIAYNTKLKEAVKDRLKKKLKQQS